MTRRERQIIELIQNDPFVSQQDIALRLGISRSAVAGHIMRLTSRGLIRGRGYVLGERDFVACVGAANVDLHGKSSAPPKAGQSNPGSIRQSAGGAARNVAENLARLGVDCRLVSMVGNDANGQYLLDETRAAGVDVSGVERSGRCGTSTYLAILGPDGDTRLAVNDMRILEEIDPGFLAPRLDMLRRARAIVIDANLPAATLSYLFAECSACATFVEGVSVAKAPRLRPHLDDIHTLKVTLDEARAIMGRRVRDADKAAAWLVEQGISRAFVTRGKGGVCFATADGETGIRSAGGAGAARSTSGAGDAFLAGLVFAFLKHRDLAGTLDNALDAARLAISEDGNVARSITEARLEAGT